MTKITTDELRRHTTEIISRAGYGKEKMVIALRGKEMAMLIPLDEYQLLERLTERLEDMLDVKALEEAMAEEGESVTLEELEQELGR